MTDSIPKEQRTVWRNHSNGQLYELWAEVSNCSDETDDEKNMVVYSHAGSKVPEFVRETKDFYRDFTRDERLQLYRFYNVSTLEGLVDKQARHIERLQAKLPPMRDEFPRTPREG